MNDSSSDSPPMTPPSHDRSRRAAMTRAWIAALGAAVLAASALGIYLNWGPVPARAPALPAAKRGEVFSLLEKRAPLPDVSFADGSGRPMKLSDFRGKVILLNIWATWCTPCRKEMPGLDRLQAELGAPGFEVVALSIDRGGAMAVKTFYEELDIKELRVYVDSTTRASSDLGAIGLPTTLLVDREGREIGRKVGPAEWDSEVAKVIRKYLQTPAAGSLGRS